MKHNLTTNYKNKMTKTVVIPNYIPLPTPLNPNFNKWYKCYKDDLLRMYSIVENTTKNGNVSDYNGIQWDKETNYNIFVNMIYVNSSKFILKSK
jgi:hypothetical protein